MYKVIIEFLSKKLPEYGFFVLLLSMMLTGSFTLDMQSHLFYGIFAPAISLVIMSFYRSFNPKLKFSLADKILVLFLILFNLSILTSQTPFGFKEFISFNVGSLVYFLAANLDLRKFYPSHLRYTVQIIMLMVFGYGFYHIMNLYDSRFSSFFRGTEVYTTYPNALASILMIVIVLGFVLKKQSKNIYSLPLISVLSFMALVLTWSRGAFLSLAVVAGLNFLYGFFKVRPLKKLFLESTKILVVATLIFSWAISYDSGLPYPVNGVTRLASQDISSSRSLNERYVHFQTAFTLGLENLMGVGPGSYEYISAKNQEDLLTQAPHAHNIILKLWSESGPVTASLFLMFLVLTLANIFRHLVETKAKLQWHYYTLFTLLVGVVIHNLVDYNLNFTSLNFIFFALLGTLKNFYLFGSKPHLFQHVKYLSKDKTSNFEAALMFYSLFLMLISTLQLAGYYNIKMIEENPEQEAQRATMASLTPFKHQYYEVTNNKNTGIHKYPNYYPVYQSATLYEKALELNPKNDLYLHYQYLDSIGFTLDATQVQEYKDLLTEYLYLLRQNAHNTVTTANPRSAYYIAKNLGFEQLALDLEFAHFNEIEKFNQRFGLELNQFEYEEDFNSIQQPRQTQDS